MALTRRRRPKNLRRGGLPLLMMAGLGIGSMFLLPKLTGGKGIGEMMSGLTGGGSPAAASSSSEGVGSTSAGGSSTTGGSGSSSRPSLQIERSTERIAGGSSGTSRPDGPVPPASGSNSVAATGGSGVANPALRGNLSARRVPVKSQAEWDPWAKVDRWGSRK